MMSRDAQVGIQVKRLREEQGLSQKELAARSGVPAGTIASLEVGRSAGGLKTLKALSDTLGTPMDVLTAARPRRDPRLASQDLRRLCERVVLQSKISTTAYDEFSQHLELYSTLLAEIQSAREKITEQVRRLHAHGVLVPETLDDELVDGLEQISDRYRSLEQKWNSQSPYHAARARYEFGKIQYVLGLVARTRTQPDANARKRNWRQKAMRSFNNAASAFEYALRVNEELMGAERTISLPIELKIAETAIERALVSLHEVAQDDFDHSLRSATTLKARYRAVVDYTSRTLGEASCAHVIAKALYCQAMRARSMGKQRRSYEPLLLECRRLAQSAYDVKRAQGDPDGCFWARSLAARCEMARLARDKPNSARTEEVKMLYEEVLSPEDRGDRRTVRSVCIVVWLYSDIREGPLRKTPWARELLHP